LHQQLQAVGGGSDVWMVSCLSPNEFFTKFERKRPFAVMNTA
jgi:hypothetical protein